MKTDKEIDAIMGTIHEANRTRWCGGENGPCACLGCVQVSNRIIMFETANREKVRFDPEGIREDLIPEEIYTRFKISKAEWENWMRRNPTPRT